MRPGLTIWALLGVIGGGVTPMLWGQSQPRQQVRLVGRVLDAARRPIEGVEVLVNRQVVRALTDSAGIFQLDVSPRDSTVGFRRIGYRPMLFTIDPLPPPGDTILVELVSSPISLPEVIISARPSKPLRYAGTTKYDEVFLRNKVGLGTLISRDAIDTRFGFDTHELLRGIAGIRIWNGPPKRIRFARCQQPGGVSVFIDGMRQIPTTRSESASESGPVASVADEPEIELLSRVDVRDIEMIEVFRGAGEIPGVFHWNGCAVIAIWTTWNR